VPKWADWLMACWAVFVVVVYYGGSSGVFNSAADPPPAPWLAIHTETLSAVYALVLIVSLASVAFSITRKSTTAVAKK